MVYIFILSVVLYLSHVNHRLTYRTRIFFILCVYAYLVLLMGLRFRVGIDTLNYMSSYDSVPELKKVFDIDFSTARFEPGYILLCSLCRSITPDFWLLQCVHSLILNGCVFYFLHKNTTNIFTGICVYIILCWLYFNTEIIRESLAISIFLLNIENLKRRRWGWYYLLCIISISFHYSALITVFFPFAKLIRLNVLYIGICILLLGITPYLENLNELISIASISDRVGEHISSADELNMNWRLANMIRYTIVPAFSLMIVYISHYKSEYTPYILLSILFGVGAFAVPIIFSRLANYTLPFVILYVSNLIDEPAIRRHYKQALAILLVCSQLIYYHEMYNAWIPYESIFSKQMVVEREQMWYDYFE